MGFFKESLQSNDVAREQLIPRDQEIQEAAKGKILGMRLQHDRQCAFNRLVWERCGKFHGTKFY